MMVHSAYIYIYKFLFTCSKTTLIKLMTGELNPTKGQVKKNSK